ncbi:hypothetical protein [Psychrobacter sp. I-STPA10]|uniref:hypothetical protein n=1 Tax=Psychrobacter sp. I-STPA10 TaxID=2585769 RepID=UPI001E559995|nr:hypothetical protein [Psychrobacter sp. I-STPA10]
MDFKDNPLLFLNKDRSFLENFLLEKKLVFNIYPEEQRVEGFDIIESNKVSFWFDCLGFIYSIHADFNKEELSLPIFLNGVKINETGYAKSVTNYFERVGKIFNESDFYDDSIGKYRLVVYDLSENIKVILNIDSSKSVFGLVINYDGYSPYQYKKGISLSDFLNTTIST